MDERQRVLIAEDHTLLRAGLRALLLQDATLEIVGEADNGRDAIRAISQLKPHLVLTIHKTDEYIHESLRAGADGYILKDATHDELRVAIRSVLNGKIYLSPDISSNVINGYLGSGRLEGRAASPWDTLTHREREVLKLVAEGHSNKYIAEYLCLSIKTVEKHRSNLMRKLDLHNASTLTAYAIEKGLVAT